jgi:hypothetical protein
VDKRSGPARYSSINLGPGPVYAPDGKIADKIESGTYSELSAGVAYEGPGSLSMKSCTRTGWGRPLGRSSRPPFLKLPTSSFFFLVPTEITGCFRLKADFTFPLRCSNRALRSGWLAPSLLLASYTSTAREPPPSSLTFFRPPPTRRIRPARPPPVASVGPCPAGSPAGTLRRGKHWGLYPPRSNRFTLLHLLSRVRPAIVGR